MKDVIIIGAGTAGLTAAIYALRAGKSVLVLEQGNYGGQIINTPKVENYPGIEQISGYEFAAGLYRQAEKLGMEYRSEKVTDIRLEDGAEAREELSSASLETGNKIVETTEQSYRARAVILATGAKNRPLGIEKEAESKGTTAVTYAEQKANNTPESADYDEVMAELQDVGMKFAENNYIDELTEIVESVLGVGKKVTECTKKQIEAMCIVLDKLKEKAAELKI